MDQHYPCTECAEQEKPTPISLERNALQRIRCHLTSRHMPMGTCATTDANRASHLRSLIDTDELMRTHRYSVRLLRSMNQDFGQIVAGLAVIPNIVKDKPI